MPRGQFDALRLDLVDGERVHVYGRPELYEQRGDFHLRALTIERFGIGAHLAALERLKHKLAAEGLFAASRKRPLPRIPALIGLVTGNDGAAKRDILTAITTRFPPAHVLVAATYVHGPRAAPAIATANAALCARGLDAVPRARAQARVRVRPRPRAFEGGHASVGSGDELVREPPAAGSALEVDVAGGRFGARSL